MRMAIVGFVAASAASCGGDGLKPSENGATACDERVNCEVVDDVATCAPGFLFEEPGTDNFTCRDTGWTVNDEIDPIDDERDVSFTLNGESYETFVGSTVKTGVALVCNGGEALVAFFVGSCERDTSDRTTATVRFGGDDAEDIEALNRDGFLIPFREDAARFSAPLRSSDTVALRFRPFQQIAKTVVFDTSDLAEVSATYGDVCGF